MPDNENQGTSNETARAGRGLALGLIFGTALGLALWFVTDIPVFFPVFAGAGICIGLVIDAREKA